MSKSRSQRNIKAYRRKLISCRRAQVAYREETKAINIILTAAIQEYFIEIETKNKTAHQIKALIHMSGQPLAIKAILYEAVDIANAQVAMNAATDVRIMELPDEGYKFHVIDNSGT